MLRLMQILSDVRVTSKSNMAANNWEQICNNDISACKHDSDKILTANPTFSGSSNTLGLMRRHLRVTDKSFSGSTLAITLHFFQLKKYLYATNMSISNDGSDMLLIKLLTI